MVSMYFRLSIVSSTTIIGPNLFQRKHAHTIKLPPPYFTVGAMQSGWKRSNFVLRIRRSRDPCHSSILHSSDQTTRFQSFNDPPRRAPHHIRRLKALAFDTYGFHITCLDWIPSVRNFLWTVRFDTSTIKFS